MEPISNSDIELDDALDYLIPRGFPTFDEFSKNPDKWRKRPEEIFESADCSSISFKDQVAWQRYMWKDEYTCKTLEELERVCKSEGFKISDLQMKPIVKPIHGTNQNGQVGIVIQFWPTDEFQAQGGKIIHE